MKKINIILTIWVLSSLTLHGCDESKEKSIFEKPSTQQTSAISTIGNLYTFQSTQEQDSNASLLSTDLTDFKKNFYKFKDITVTFEPENPKATILSDEKYDIVLTQGKRRELLFKDLVIGKISENPIEITETKDPYILEFKSGFGDAGNFSFTSDFINLVNEKKLVVINESHDLTNKKHNHYIIGNNTYSLLDTSKKELCIKDLQIESILRNNKPIAKLSKPIIFSCYSGELESESAIQLIGLNKNLDKTYIQITKQGVESIPASSSIYEIDVKTGNLTALKDSEWEKDNIFHFVSY